MRFGISTHLYHDQPLGPAHLQAIAAQGFDSVELFATRTHFNYRQPAAIQELGAWLGQAGLELHSIHAPIVDSIVGTTWGRTFSNAAPDEAGRQRAVQEVAAALDVARAIPTKFLVLHLGIPRDQAKEPGENNREAARRSLEEIGRLVSEAGVRLAIEVIPNGLSDAAGLVELLEDDLELPGAGICLDFGHAFLMGDLLDAIETVSGHLITTHVHDNQGKVDEHLVPFEGAIDWPAALMTTQKIGYEGTLLFEVRNSGDAAAVLARTSAARRRFEQILGED